MLIRLSIIKKMSYSEAEYQISNYLSKVVPVVPREEISERNTDPDYQLSVRLHDQFKNAPPSTSFCYEANLRPTGHVLWINERIVWVIFIQNFTPLPEEETIRLPAFSGRGEEPDIFVKKRYVWFDHEAQCWMTPDMSSPIPISFPSSPSLPRTTPRIGFRQDPSECNTSPTLPEDCVNLTNAFLAPPTSSV